MLNIVTKFAAPASVHVRPPVDSSGSRPGSNGGSREERTKAKIDKREAMYENALEVVKRREALSHKVLHTSPKVAVKKSDAPVPPSAELGGDLEDWMREERKRADAVSEKKWKAKFIEWHSKHLAKEDQQLSQSLRQHSASEMDEVLSSSAQSDSIVWTGLDPNDPDAVALVKQAERLQQESYQMMNRQEQLEDDINSFRDELKIEGERKANVEKLLAAMIDDRDAWSASASRHDLMRKRFVKEQRDTNTQVADLHSQLGNISDQLTVEAK